MSAKPHQMGQQISCPSGEGRRSLSILPVGTDKLAADGGSLGGQSQTPTMKSQRSKAAASLVGGVLPSPLMQGSHAAIFVHGATADISQRAPRALMGMARTWIEEHCRCYAGHQHE